MAAAGASSCMTMLNSPAGRFSFPGAAPTVAAVPGSVGQPAAPSSSVAGKQEAAGRVASIGQEEQATHASEPGSGGGAGFERFLGQVVQTGAVPLQMPLFSAHQMGTCRLGK